MIIDCFAKINLTLDILYKRDDGFHELKTVFQHIDVKDKIELVENSISNIEIDCNIKELENETNICYKTALILKEKFGVKKGIKIKIDKIIPIGAGLSGGSSNAAGVLKGLNKIWKLNLSETELIEISRNIGMDVAFHIIGGTCTGEGRGEIIKKCRDFQQRYIVVVYPDIFLNTGLMYKNLNYDLIGKTNSTIQFLKNYDLKYLHNDFEFSVYKLYPEIKILKDMLGINSLLSGSGSCVFKIAENKDDALRTIEKISKKYKTVFLAKTLNTI